ncbi:MAG: hypothetical protein F4047_14000 [Caldilineaceae bacterium SB0670_bin_27]|uniref:DUF4276 family protein n=1 Tax=Caldilineaceae bacterium SB0664_bin_27 TaxID=2605260 RepID=A0A6B0YQ29_9CHLR|nr:hypothetical protein [Caldilineaceae bacterium SB0664_bin_27]MYJ79225.1 hypothetical protein [Caldilineaceae bacterium SB0670_bin_27]
MRSGSRADSSFSQRYIALFVEDYAHQKVIGALVTRVAAECDVEVRLDWRNAMGGHGKVIVELRNYIRDLKRQGTPWPDLIIVATDANCKGLNERSREIGDLDAPAPVLLAIPDPHVERWLLLDGAAFRAVFGRGCQAPDRKCSRELYKRKLIEEIHAAGGTPILGGIEYAEDILCHMDIDRAARADDALQRFVSDLRTTFRGWQL